MDRRPVCTCQPIWSVPSYATVARKRSSFGVKGFFGLAGGMSGADAPAVEEILEQHRGGPGVAFAGAGLLLSFLG